MGRRVLRRHIWGYTVCLCPIKGTSGLNELSNQLCFLCFIVNELNVFSYLVSDQADSLGADISFGFKKQLLFGNCYDRCTRIIANLFIAFVENQAYIDTEFHHC